MLRFPVRKEPPQLPFDDLSGVSAPSAFSSYRVLHQIGSGVLGPVFRAHDSTGRRLVAIKALKLDLVPEAAERLTEALRTIAARAEGVPGLVATVDCGIERGTPFLAVDYMSGDALDVSLRQSPPLGLEDARLCLAAIARSIDAAWAQDVSHGALHPRDVFLGASPGDVSITGFGVTQALEDAGARTPVRLPYSAPERVAGSPWDRRADIYALGAIAREMTGRSAVSRVPAAWERAIARAMAEDPAARFETAGAFAEALTPMPAAKKAAAVAAPIVADAAPAATGAPPDLDLMRAAPAAAPGLPALRSPEIAALVPAPPGRFPWTAVAAVGVAGVALGLVGGYYWGATQAHRASGVAQDARVASPPPPVAVAPDARPPLPGPPPASVPAVAGGAENAVPPVSPGPRAERQAPAPARGSLVVDSRPPKASVTIDGRPVGETRLTIQDLSPGMHSVLIQLKGHRPVRSSVAIVAGEQTKLAVSLERLAAVIESLPRKSR